MKPFLVFILFTGMLWWIWAMEHRFHTHAEHRRSLWQHPMCTSPIIPKHILQTYHSHDLPSPMQQHIQNMRWNHTDYRYDLITDDDGIRLIQTQFLDRTDILAAFRKLNTGAAKGDFLDEIGDIYM